MLVNSGKDNSAIINLSVKKDGKYVRLFSSIKELVGTTVPDDVMTGLETNKLYPLKDYHIGGKVCEKGLVKNYGNYIIGIGERCK